MSENIMTRESEEAAEGHRLLREACGLLELHHIGLLELTGDDRKGWLQGQVTNDLRKLDTGGSIAFCVCTPTGQIVANCELWALVDRYLIAAPREAMPALLERVHQMVILENVEARDLSDSYRLFSVQGPAATKALSEFTHLPSLDAAETRVGEQPAFCLRANRTGYGGWDLWLPIDAQRPAELASLPHVGEEAYEIARIEARIPLFGKDIGPKTMPPELGPEFDNKNVSYRKGCYTGQEVLMRIHSRGHTNRTWVGLFTDDFVEPGSAISWGARGEVGAVTSSAISPVYGPIAAGYVRNEAAADGEEVIIESGGRRIAAEVRQMPLLRPE
jgi:folate-binding protein YgfZ